MDKLLQSALKEIYGSLGGNLDNVRDLDDIAAILHEIALLGIGDALSAAAVKELPEAPESDGTYLLTCTVDEGAATLSYEAQE